MPKKTITLYMHVHQPWRIKPYTMFNTGVDHDYYTDTTSNSLTNNKEIFCKVADKSYRPMNALLLKLLKQNPNFKLSLSITGTFMEQAERWAPDILDDFKKLFATGQVELVGETYYHSLAFFYNRHEFERQVTIHAIRAQKLFGVTPKVFRNTELAYNNELAIWAEQAGYSGIIAEGWDPLLGERSPGHVYSPKGTNTIGVLLKNYRLSDDIAFRFSDKQWNEWPLTVEKYTNWLNERFNNGDELVNLFMDYETFGEHQWSDTEIFKFFENFVYSWLEQKDACFATVSEAINDHQTADQFDAPSTITWADKERDLSAWMENSMQQESLHYLYDLTDDIYRANNPSLLQDWARMQASDHVYYMSTKHQNDGDVHAYFSPYDSPYDAFLYFMNALRDIRYRLAEQQKEQL